MSLFASFYHQIALNRLRPWLNTLPPVLQNWETQAAKKDFAKHRRILQNLPGTQPSLIDLKKAVQIGQESDISDAERERIRTLLMHLCPWRKGPFWIHGLHIDTEWRSDWKWDRLLPHIQPLKDRYVLDVGCGSGYHLWRMSGEEAGFVVGVDPYDLFFNQFLAIQHFHADPNIHFLPLGIDDLPTEPVFDTVFSMGVLYHRRSPIDFLKHLKSQLRPGGELVLETLLVAGDAQTVLMPEDRYARMPNVWMIPSYAALEVWLQRSGFKLIRLVDLNITTPDEQRQSDWMTAESLAQSLNPDDPRLTREGYPAPMRGIILAQA